MPEYAEFTVLFYQVKLESPSGMAFDGMLRQLATMPVDARTRKYGAAGHIRAEGIADHRGFVVGDLVRLRSDQRPTKGTLEEDGTWPVVMEENEHICEETAFVYHPGKRILALQRNSHGVTMASFEIYLKELFHQESIRAGIVLEADVARRLDRLSEVRSIQIEVARVKGASLADDSLAIGRMLEVGGAVDAAVVEMEVKMGHFKGGLHGVKAFMTGLLSARKKDAKAEDQSIKTLRVKGFDKDLARVTLLDLLEPALQRRVKVKLSDHIAKVEARVEALIDAWNASEDSMQVVE